MINKKDCFNKDEVLRYIDYVLTQAEILDIYKTKSFEKKIGFLKDMKTRVESRLLPSLRKEDGWSYRLEATMSGIYLNLVVTDEFAATLPNGRKSAPGFHMIEMRSKHITLLEFAALNEISEATLRQQIRQGYFVYAKKTGTSWTIPEMSRPMRDDQIKLGQFYVFEDIGAFIASDSTRIDLSKNDRVQIFPLERNENNKKRFLIKIETYDLDARKATNQRSFELGVKDKSAFILHLIKAPDTQFWSDDISIYSFLTN